MPTRLFRTWTAVLLATTGLASPVFASQPAQWYYADENDFRRGTIDGLALHPTLGLSLAPRLTRTDVDAEFIHTWLRDGSKLWLGTGLVGKLFLFENGKVREVAKVDSPLIAALVSDGQGGVYAGLVGKGEIVRIGPDGKVTSIAKLKKEPSPAKPGAATDDDDATAKAAADPSANHIWALVKQGNTLYAGTGPGGRVFAIDLATKAVRVHAETGTDHVLVLLQDGQALIAGTSDNAMILRIDGEKKVRALASFPGGEVRSIARSGKALYAVVNGGATAVPLASMKPSPERPGSGPGAKPASANKTGKDAAAKGKGAVWKRTDDGIVQRVFVSPEGMLSEIGVVGKSIVAGAARGGRVVLGDDFGDVQSLFDLKEEEVLGVEVGAKGPQTLFTGKSAAVYTVGGDDTTSVFTTEVLSETGVAQWGKVEAIGEGSLTVESRSGFSEQANDTWSPWQPLKDGVIQSPPASSLQVRVKLGSPQSRLTELRVFRQVINRPPMITKIDTVANRGKNSITVSWATEDADNDNLGFLVQYRLRGTRQWLMMHDRLYDKKTMEISPHDMPDGWYEMRVEVTDLPANAAKMARATARISKPFLVDRGLPTVTGQVAGRMLTGTATDATSRITKVEVSVDGEPVQLAAARDGIFDQTKEAFELELPASIATGQHTLLVQATDEAGNVGVARVTVGQ